MLWQQWLVWLQPLANTFVYLPLDFWFCRNPGCALPLIALQYHEVKVRVELDTLANMKLVDNPSTEILLAKL